MREKRNYKCDKFLLWVKNHIIYYLNSEKKNLLICSYYSNFIDKDTKAKKGWKHLSKPTHQLVSERGIISLSYLKLCVQHVVKDSKQERKKWMDLINDFIFF